MYKIRQIKYSANSVSIQVYKIENRKRVIVRHIGTARNEQEQAGLLALANDLIEKISKQLFLFGDEQAGNVLYINQTLFIGVYYSFLYDLISKLIIIIGFDKVKNNLLLDLVIVRMMEPASKLRAICAFRRIFRHKTPKTKLLQVSTRVAFPTIKSRSYCTCICEASLCFQFRFVVL